MAFIKLPDPEQPGFFNVINTDFVTHVTTMTGEAGGHINFYVSGLTEPYKFTFDAHNKAGADVAMSAVLKALLDAKDISVNPTTRARLRSSGGTSIH